MTKTEFYNELAKKTGMSEADSRHFWDQSAEFIVDAVISKCYRDGGTLEVPGIGTARAELITCHLPLTGPVQSTRLYFNRSSEFRDKLATFRVSQRKAEETEKRAANNNPDITAFAAVLEKSPDLAATLRRLIVALDSAPKMH